MQQAVKDMEPLDFQVPDSIEFRPVDLQTGLLSPEDSTEAYIEVFAPGTAPMRYALEEKKSGGWISLRSTWKTIDLLTGVQRKRPQP
jgi:membrane carboxypeptidase/penicillin-binding protein